MYCPYCGVEHGETVEFSREEVVPYAVGGSRQFAIRVCRNSNNSFGGSVDKPFAEMFHTRARRHFLGLRGTDGTKPSIDLSGEMQIDGTTFRVKHTINENNIGRPEILPKVSTTPVAGGKLVTVRGDPRTARRILEDNLRTAAWGKQVRDTDGKVLKLEDLDALLASRTVEHVNPSILKTSSSLGLML